MASASITRRQTGSGPRYVVRFRLGGRAYPIRHAGSFPKLELAKTRLGFVQGELAAGRDPTLALQALSERPPVRTFADWADAYKASRIDASASTLENIETHLKALLPVFGKCDPFAISLPDVQAWASASTLAPSSLRGYLGTLRMVLDFADVEKNPARDRRLRLPENVHDEIVPPTGKQFRAILDHVSDRWVLPLILLEQVGLRSSEVAILTWGNVDLAENKLRLPARNTKRRRPHSPQVPAWLMDEIDATCPLEDRMAERRVFPGYGRNAARNAVARACKTAGIPHFHPHDFRHRRISLWHQDRTPIKEIAERVSHSRASMTLDVYSHVMTLDELTAAELQAVIHREGVVSVRRESEQPE